MDRTWMAAIGLTSMIAAISAPAYARQTSDLSLIEALQHALDDNPTLAAAEQEQRATRENIAQARAPGLPQVTGSTNYQSSEQTVPDFLGVAGQQELVTFQYQFEATQTVFAGLSNWNAIRQAKAQVRAGEARLYATRQDIILNVVTAFLDVLRDREVLKLRNNNVTVLTRQREAAQARFRVGEVTRTDVAQAEARLSNARAAVFAARAQLAASEANFEAVAGLAATSLAPAPETPAAPPSQGEALEFSRDNAPLIISARETETASRRGAQAAKGALAPRVEGFARYADTSNPSFFQDENEETTVGVRASIPLFAGGANYSRIRQTARQNSADRLRVVEAERSVREQVIAAWTQLEAARATIDAATSAVSANEIAFEGVRQEAQVGARTTLDVLDAEQELLDARVQLVTAERDENVAVYSLLAAIGALTPERFGLL
ncbi:MAG: TolC family outer membrane protein [Pseudomonadota bacterium]